MAREMNQLNADSEEEEEEEEEDGGYTLGFEDGQITKQSELDNHSISRIGGKPVLLPLESTRIPQNDWECRICQKPIPMLAQVYCPNHQNQYHDRIIYLFACVDQKCQSQGESKCVRAFKSWKFNEQYYRQSSSQTKTALYNVPSDLGDNPFKMNTHNLFQQSFDNPFSIQPSLPPPAHQDPVPEPSGLENPFSNLTMNSNEQSTTIQKDNAILLDNVPVLCNPAHYLTTDYETKPELSSCKTYQDFFDEPTHTQKQQPDSKSSNKKKLSSSSTSGSSKTALESYEVQLVKGVDPAFLDFQDRINWNHQASQVLRYNPNGKPLRVHSTMPSPSIEEIKCGHKTRFELQLMPAGLTVLFREQEMLIDWTTVWIRDCVHDCLGKSLLANSDTHHQKCPRKFDPDFEGWIELPCFVQFIND
ncbi:hypothetical protein MJO29_010710 [Puccinia striiformis f. sp. tritici]|nr:hypothetical protein MJO29_010710 [Puccinia striiformis f. sp. tritici]